MSQLFLCCYIGGAYPKQPGKLLYVGRVIVHKATDFFGKLGWNVLPGIFKAFADIFYPIFSLYFGEIDRISEFVEWKILFSKSSFIRCFLLPKGNMRHAAVVATPYVAFSEMFLNPQNLRFVGTRQCRSLFESLFLSQSFQVIARYHFRHYPACYTQRDRKVVHRVCANGNFGIDMCEKLFGVLNPLVPFGRSLF